MKSVNNDLWNAIEVEELEVRDEFGCFWHCIDCFCINCINFSCFCISCIG